MKKAYIILAHKNPLQLQRLVRALDDGSSHFFLHIDGRTGIDPFTDLLHSQKHISILPRVKTEWGGLGLVNAVMNGLKAATQPGNTFDHIILLSGQDYPIKSKEQINAFLAKNTDKIFLEYFPLPFPAKWKPGGGLYRVNKYFMGLKIHQRYAAKAANLMGTLFPPARRKTYGDMKPFAGSMWWVISAAAARYITGFVEENPGYARFHRFTFAPDELFFHMILLNAKNEKIRSSIINNDLHFIRWKDKGSAHPEILTKKDFGELMRSDALFARKFDASADAEILDLMDAHCRAGNTAAVQTIAEELDSRVYTS